MNHGRVLAGLAVILSLTLAGCGSTGAGSGTPEPDETIAAPTQTPTDPPTPAPTGSGGTGTDAGEPLTDPPSGDPEHVVPADVDLASPTTVKRTVAQDVAVRVQVGSVVRFSPRAFAVAGNQVTVSLHVIGDYAYYDGPIAFYLVPTTWSPAPTCGAEPTGAVETTRSDVALGSVSAPDDTAMQLTFVPTTTGPWYFVAAIGDPATCNVAAWSVPVEGAKR